MLDYPQINPVAFHLGPLAVHWYGLMYLFGFLLAWLYARWRTAHYQLGWSDEEIADLIFFAAVGVVMGGRLGYMLFYATPELIAHPLSIFKVWDGGMSFHGGLLGVMLAVWWFCYSRKRHFFAVTDFVVPLVPLGLACGRLGNFINGELWGRVTTVPWAMVFPRGGPLPRHPSQLYELFFEGIVLFVLLFWFSIKPRPRFAITALFLLCYGVFRFAMEFFRQPDPQLGFIAFGWLTMGQLLSLPMILVGAVSLWFVYHRQN